MLQITVPVSYTHLDVYKRQTKGTAAKAEEHRQIWQILMDVLQKAVEILGDAPMSLDTFARILSAGLEESSMGLIPPTADSLLVGDICLLYTSRCV